MLYMVTFIINIPQMLAYILYMDPMGYVTRFSNSFPFTKDSQFIVPLGNHYLELG